MEYYKVSAFKLEPLTDKGILVVDGESMEYSAIEMKVIPNLACVIC
jgi:sphingosine kinase